MIRIVILVALTILQLSRSQVRVLQGKDLGEDKPYVAYLAKAGTSEKKYDSWLCGGAIVTMQHIVTSAACLADVEKMYAIAGYNKYVPHDQIFTDPCTSVAKKEVIQTCMPIIYSFEFAKASQWSNADIGIARIKGHWDFSTKFEACSYAPGAIAINYRSNWQGEGMHAIVMGWGHNDTWRNVDDTNDYNSPTLKFAKVKIVSKKVCVEAFRDVENLEPVINTYMICTNGTGRMNETGDFEGPDSYERDETQDDGCALRGANGECLKLKQRQGEGEANADEGRSGICQNDHGGPLVTYAGRAERLIGVASVFHINTENRQCQGPFMYTSTFCNQKFLRCFFGNISNSAVARRKGDNSFEDEETRRYYSNICLQPPALRGFDILERTISWTTNDHDVAVTKDKDTKEPPTVSPVNSNARSNTRPSIRKPRPHSRSKYRAHKNRPSSRHTTRPTTTSFSYEGYLLRHQIPLGSFG